MDPTFSDLYKFLGLTPLEEYALSNGNPSGRGRGASTWMCVAALHYLSNKQSVYLIAADKASAENLANLVWVWCARLNLGGRRTGYRPNKEASYIRLNNGADLFWKSGKAAVVRVVGFHDGVVLNDGEWAKRLERRMEGPFAMVISIVRKGPLYIGYAENDEEVLTFTKKGAYEFVSEHPHIRTVGWGFWLSRPGVVTSPTDPSAQVP